jgi:hypothetical protein
MNADESREYLRMRESRERQRRALLEAAAARDDRDALRKELRERRELATLAGEGRRR